MSERFIYFLRPIGSDGPVKIGCSEAPVERLKQLMTWAPVPLEIVAQFPGGFDLERNIHECLSDMHSHHEWFHADPRLTGIIEKLRAGVSIAEAMDLSARVGSLRKKAKHWMQNPESRVRTSYVMKLHWACRKIRSETSYFSLPDRADEIIARWRGFSPTYRANPITPSSEELVYLQEVIDYPDQHLIARPLRHRLAA